MITLKQFGSKITSLDLESIDSELQQASSLIEKRNGAGNDFVGWLDYASKLPESELDDIIATAQRLRRDYDTLVCVGIGGSYLGGRCVIEAINGLFPADDFKIVYLGDTLSAPYTTQLLKWLANRNYAVNVISKSGTTTEPAVAFRLLKEDIEQRWGRAELKDRIVATTDRAKGALKSEADAVGYKSFVIPDDIGGRFSVITPVGLLPLACANIDIKAFMKGVADGERDYGSPDWHENLAYRYGATRYLLETKVGYASEMFVTYEPQDQMIGEWLKQLFGESLGKDGKGLFPTSCVFTTDLHSMGQFIQQGTNCLFETVIKEQSTPADQDVVIKEDAADLDHLNYLAGKKLSYINDKAFEAVLSAHTDGQIDANVIELPKMDAYNLGNLFYFFFRACAFSGYLLGINPFDQPGVEKYKHNMFVLLGKPGVK